MVKFGFGEERGKETMRISVKEIKARLRFDNPWWENKIGIEQRSLTRFGEARTLSLAMSVWRVTK